MVIGMVVWLWWYFDYYENDSDVSLVMAMMVNGHIVLVMWMEYEKANLRVNKEGFVELNLQTTITLPENHGAWLAKTYEKTQVKRRYEFLYKTGLISYLSWLCVFENLAPGLQQ